MNIIIAGAGEVGKHLALSLSQEAHQIVVIDQDEKLIRDLESNIDGRMLLGDVSSVNILAEAGIDDCDLFFALTSDNNTNLVCSSIAKNLGAKKVLCRVHPGLQREEWLFDHRGHFGIDYMFSSERLAAIELAKFIRNPDSILVEELARGRIEIQQITVSEFSGAHQVRIQDLKLPPRIRIATIHREARSIPPTAEETLHAGDIITLFGEPHKLREVVKKLGTGIYSNDAIKVVIFGGSEYGFALAQMLEGWNCKVRIFEEDAALCEDLGKRLSQTTMIHADATSIRELVEEQVGEADFFVAASDSDEDNVMTCIQTHNIGVPHCLTLIHRSDYADAISQSGTHFGIKAAVSPREATRKELTRFITSDRYHVVKEIGENEIIEATVGNKSKIANQKVSDITWPEGSGLVALIHEIHATVPSAEDVIKPGDNLYAIVDKKAKKPFLKLLQK